LLALPLFSAWPERIPLGSPSFIEVIIKADSNPHLPHRPRSRVQRCSIADSTSSKGN
jgi:hypothetical protein